MTVTTSITREVREHRNKSLSVYIDLLMLFKKITKLVKHPEPVNKKSSVFKEESSLVWIYSR